MRLIMVSGKREPGNKDEKLISVKVLGRRASPAQLWKSYDYVLGYFVLVRLSVVRLLLANKRLIHYLVGRFTCT